MKAEDLSCVHMFPCDLGEMSEKETYRIAYSLPVGSADKGETVPLFTLEQAKRVLSDDSISVD